MQDLERRIRGYKKERPIIYTRVFISNYCKQEEANVFSVSMYVVDLFGY